jgi:hypothetical protein
MSVEISPMWRSSDVERHLVEVTLLDEEGKEVDMAFVPVP